MLLYICLIIWIGSDLGQGVDIDPRLYQNILKAPWGINFKYNGEVHHNLDRIWVVTKVPMPRFDKLNFPEWKIAENCTFTKSQRKTQTEGIEERRYAICMAYQPAILQYRIQAKELRNRLRRLVKKDLQEIFPHENSLRRKRSVIGLITGVVSLVTIAAESISSHLKRKREQAIANSLRELHETDHLIQNKLHQFKEEFLMYGKYSLETMEEMIGTIGSLDKRIKLVEENMMTGYVDLVTMYLRTFTDVQDWSAQFYSYIELAKVRYLTMTEALIQKGEELLKAIGTLSRGYLPIELFPPSTLAMMTEEVAQMVRKTHPEYILAIEDLTLYYDMKLVTFSIDDNKDLVVTFPIFVKQYTTQPMVLYEIETVPVPIIDKNKEDDSYSEVQIHKPYLATNQNYYIQMRIQELRMCKSIRYEYYCEELFLVKHRTTPSCEATLFYSDDKGAIVQHCQFTYWQDKNVTPSILDGGNQIVLANMMKEKRLICSRNANLAEPLPSYSYVTVNRTLLCNCELDASLSYVQRSIGSCKGDETDTQMTFVSNYAFETMFDEFIKTETPTSPRMENSKKDKPWTQNWSPTTTPAQVLNIELRNNQGTQNDNAQHVNPLEQNAENLWTLYLNMKANMTEAKSEIGVNNPINKQIDLITTHQDKLIIATSICSAVNLGLLMVLLWKYFQLKNLMLGLAIQTFPMTSAKAFQQEEPQIMICSPTPWLTYVVTAITITGAVIYMYRIWKRLALWTGPRISASYSIFLNIKYGPYFVPIKLCTEAGYCNRLTLTRQLEQSQVQNQMGLLWDTVKINWQDITLKNGNKKIPLPHTIQVPLPYKYRLRKCLQNEDNQPNLMAKEGNNWYKLYPEN